MTWETNDRIRWRFTNEHEPLGNFGERLWANIFRGCGLFYIKLADLPAINRKGPRLQGSDAILPDFQVSGQRTVFVDSKCKSGPVLYRKAGEWRQGIDRKDYESYVAISEIQRNKALLAICEIFTNEDRKAAREWSGALLLQTLGTLGKPIAGFSNQDHMLYWPRSRFAVLAAGTSPLRLWQLAHGAAEPDDDLRKALRSVIESSEVIQGRFA